MGNTKTLVKIFHQMKGVNLNKSDVEEQGLQIQSVTFIIKTRVKKLAAHSPGALA
jgi:hypothetical protein